MNLENITDKHHEHVKKVWETFEIRNLGEYHDLYIQCDTFLLADVFENFINMYFNEYGLDPAHFLSVPRLAWQVCLKKTKVELELLTDIDMLLMVKKGTRGRIFRAINRYAKANNKHMKNYNKDLISSYLTYLDVNNLHHLNGFKWVEKLSRFNNIFMKDYNENSNTGYFFEVDIDYPKKLFDLHKDLPFLLEGKKVNKVEKLIFGIEDKEKYVMNIRVLKQALNHGLVF